MHCKSGKNNNNKNEVFDICLTAFLIVKFTNSQILSLIDELFEDAIHKMFEKVDLTEISKT